MVASSMLEFRNSVYLVDLVTRKVLTLTPEGGKTWDCFDMTGRDELTRWTGSGDYFSIHLNRIKDGNFPPMEYWGK